MKGIKILLVVSGLLALLAGLAMTFAAGPFLASQGLPGDDKIQVLAWAQASLLLAIAVTNFLGVRVSDKNGLSAICGGNVAAHVFGLIVNARALSGHLVAQQVYGDVVMHVIFGAAFTWAVLSLRST